MKRSKKRKNKVSAKTTVLALVLVCVLCLVGVILLTCGAKEEISSQQALEIVLEDLGLTAEQAGSPHVHEGTYQNQSCYNIYITVNGESLTYVVSTTGEILHKGEGGHSH